MSGSSDRIFISYRRKGGAHTAQAISDALSDRFGRDAVFFDVQSIDAGTAYPDRLRDGLLRCDLMIVVIDPFWLDIRHEDGRRRLDDPGDWVRLEVEAALREGKTVVPVLAISARMPNGDELPEPIAALADRQALLLRWGRDFRHDIDGLIEAAEKILGPANRQPTFWSVPHHQNRFFTGRDELLADVKAALDRDGIAVLRGLGGIGKTGVAVEYAYRHRDDHTAVFWVRAETATDLFTGFVEMARLLDLPQANLPDQNEAVQAVLRWLDSHDGWLLVLDNLDAPEVALPFLPQHRRGHVLATSRATAFDSLGVAGPLAVRNLPHEESLRFLLKRTAREESPQPELAAAAALIVELDGLPLAMEQAAAYICRHQVKFADYLEGYRRRHLEVLNKVRPQSGEYDKTVATTWSLSFQRIDETAPASAELLRFLAFLSPDAIPLELLTLGGEELGDTLAGVLKDADALAIGELFEPLTRYSLVDVDPESRTCSLHRLVQEVLQAGMGDDDCHLWAHRTVRAVYSALPIIGSSSLPLFERLSSHVLAAARLIGDWNLTDLDAADLLTSGARWLRETGHFDKIEALYRRALEIREKLLGPDHPTVAESLCDLASFGLSISYEEAEKLYSRTLDIRQRTLGAEHPDVAYVLYRLALVYSLRGKDEEAEVLERRALAMYEKLLALPQRSNDPALQNLDTADTVRLLAYKLYDRRGKRREAEPLYRWALQVFEKEFGPEHLAVTNVLRLLARVYVDQCKYEEAESLYKRELAINERWLGPDYPGIDYILMEYAELLRKTDRIAEAEVYEARAAAIRSKCTAGG